jgi:hypothetical protein
MLHSNAAFFSPIDLSGFVGGAAGPSGLLLDEVYRSLVASASADQSTHRLLYTWAQTQLCTTCWLRAGLPKVPRHCQDQYTRSCTARV